MQHNVSVPLYLSVEVHLYVVERALVHYLRHTLVWILLLNLQQLFFDNAILSCL